MNLDLWMLVEKQRELFCKCNVTSNYLLTKQCIVAARFSNSVFFHDPIKYSQEMKKTQFVVEAGYS